MSTLTPKSDDLIDALIRQSLGLEPAIVVRLAEADTQVRLRSDDPPVTLSPLDGLDVLARRVIATSLSLRTHRGAVALATEQQARAAGWPDVRLANLSIVLGWAMAAATEPASAHPVLVEADDIARASPLLRLAGLPSLDRLLAASRRRRPRRSTSPDDDRGSTIRHRSRRFASPETLLRHLLGIDARTVPLTGDAWRPVPTSASARAVEVWSTIALEMRALADVMAHEPIPAVRIKTERDAELGGHPGAIACNVALLLAAGLTHGTGYTLHFLPADDAPARALIDASRQMAKSVADRDIEARVVDVLHLQDLARRGWIHVGSRAAQSVARRLHDASIAAPVT